MEVDLNGIAQEAHIEEAAEVASEILVAQTGPSDLVLQVLQVEPP